MNRIDRLTAMILMLQSRRVVTADQMAEHFEVSVRTVYRDIAALSEVGVPIVAEAGVGYSLMQGYHMPPIMFTEAEAAALFMSGGIAVQFSDGSLKERLEDALLKVRAALPEGHKDYLSQMDQRVEVWSKSNGMQDEGMLMPIQDAVVKRRCVSICYDTAARGELTTRVVEALGLVFYGRRWHLIAWCRLRASIRDFRLDRIKEWEVLEEVFTAHDDFSVTDFYKAEVCDEVLSSVIFECERWALDRVMSELPCEVIAKDALENGRYLIEARTYSVEWLAKSMIGLGTSVLVKQPLELGQILRAEAEKIADLYK
ncbi:helix-turn-helix transcriptional regulator [Rubritalea sp.]|uniref:helix-turn-helix transcriptional regulator n=1 Tax=Rubritalea sp. TaxID=2109375 RepID=UPI003EF2DA2A